MLSEASLNLSNTNLNLEVEEREAMPKRRVSSANKAWFMFLIPLAIHNPLISWSCIFLSSRKLSTKAWMTNNRGERGHPCLSPLEALKNSVALPFTRGEIQGSEMHARIYFMKFAPKRNLHMNFKRNLWFTWSKAFAKLGLITIPCSFRRRLECIASWTSVKLSTICPPFDRKKERKCSPISGKRMGGGSFVRLGLTGHQALIRQVILVQ